MSVLDVFVDLADNLISFLPHNYDKRSESNIGKVIRVFSAELNEIFEQKNEIYSNINIDNAEGVYLDRTGRNFGQVRGGLEDGPYRVLIKARISQNLSPGDVNSLIEYISALLLIENEEVEIRDFYKTQYEEMAYFEIYIDYEHLDSANIEPERFVDTVDNLRAAGIRFLFFAKGTLRLAEYEESKIDNEVGLSSLIWFIDDNMEINDSYELDDVMEIHDYEDNFRIFEKRIGIKIENFENTETGGTLTGLYNPKEGEL